MNNMESENNVYNSIDKLRTVTPLSKYLAMSLFIAMPFLGALVGYTYAPEKVVWVENVEKNTIQPVSEEVFAPEVSSYLYDAFDLKNKESNTSLYYSEKLGVGFTYLPIVPYTDQRLTVTEIENTIYMHWTNQNPTDGLSIEVFAKDTNVTFTEGITNLFLKGINPKDCFVRISNLDDTDSRYVSGIITFPESDNLDSNFWGENYKKCPPMYTATNGGASFRMNKAVPEKFIFVKIGQDGLTSDGSPVRKSETGDTWYGWSRSIQILK